jgi:hypothetical protein
MILQDPLTAKCLRLGKVRVIYRISWFDTGINQSRRFLAVKHRSVGRISKTISGLRYTLECKCNAATPSIFRLGAVSECGFILMIKIRKFENSFNYCSNVLLFSNNYLVLNIPQNCLQSLAELSSYKERTMRLDIG